MINIIQTDKTFQQDIFSDLDYVVIFTDKVLEI